MEEKEIIDNLNKVLEYDLRNANTPTMRAMKKYLENDNIKIVPTITNGWNKQGNTN